MKLLLRCAAKQKQPGLFEPLGEVFKGFGELLGSVVPAKGPAAKKGISDFAKSEERKRAEGEAKIWLYQHYKIFKKFHRCMHW